HRDILCERMARWCAERTTSEVLEALCAAGIPAGPVLSLRDALAHPQTQALGLLKDVTYEGVTGRTSVADIPLQFSASEVGIHTPPPQAGEHTDEILAELGYDDSALAALRMKQII